MFGVRHSVSQTHSNKQKELIVLFKLRPKNHICLLKAKNILFRKEARQPHRLILWMILFSKTFVRKFLPTCEKLSASTQPHTSTRFVEISTFLSFNQIQKAINSSFFRTTVNF